MELKDRIQEILIRNNLSAASFADEIGVQRSGISHILSGRNKPSYDLIERILKRFPDINPEWFIMGNGPVERTGGSQVIQLEQKSLFPEHEPVKTDETETITASDAKKQSRKQSKKEVKMICVFYTDNTVEKYTFTT